MKSPLDFFFAMGDKVTRGDPQRQQDFTYYMLWILFLAFTYMFILNAYRLIITLDPNYAIWTAVGFAIAGLQFFSLKGMYDLRQIKKGKKPMPKPEKLDSVEEMMESFKLNEKEEKDNAIRKEKEKS